MDPEHAPAHQQQQPLDGSSFGSHASQHTATLAAAALPPASDAASEVAPSEIGRGVSRLSSRYPESVWELGTEDGGYSRRGTLTGMFRKHKKAKAIELDALRFEMGQLQERHALAERDLAAARHELGQLGAERDHLANQVGGVVQDVQDATPEGHRGAGMGEGRPGGGGWHTWRGSHSTCKEG